MKFYQKTVSQTLLELKSKFTGLNDNQVRRSRQKHGANIIKVKNKSFWRKLIEPFLDVFILVLIIAGFISVHQGHEIDALVIFVVVIVNAVISYIQTYSTERILRQLNKTDQQMVGIKRNNKVVNLSIDKLVVGDIIILAEGDKVPADARIIECNNLKVDESMLTGESLPIDKQTAKIATKKPIYERNNMIYGGSFVISGNLEAVVTKVGMATEFGKIANFGQIVTSLSPIQKKINKLITRIIVSVLVAMVGLFIIMISRGNDFESSLNFILATTVSVVPEGLSIAITIVLAIAMKRMAKNSSLVRNLRSIETIGVINLIATDKTGTLTYNKLSVKQAWTLKSKTNLKQIIKATIIANGKDNYSDPLDQALANYTADQKGLKKLVKILPFNQELALSGAVWSDGKKQTLFLKGSPEKIINYSKLSKPELKKISSELNKIVEAGNRAIGLAKLELKKDFSDWDNLEIASLEFCGLIGLADTVRRQAKTAVKQAQKAGVKVVMITGDHYKTAHTIGKQLNIASSIDQVFDLSLADKMSESDFENKVLSSTVFARVTPELKFKILKTLQKQNIVAMTGDGVNDTPAIIKSDIGIAMGSGSSIAKNASDIVLLDDNFASIVGAMREGRTSVHNIRRMLYYMLSTNIGELLTFVGAIVFNLPLPLAAIQILWINLLTDTTFVIPLGLEPTHKDIMNKKPEPINAPLLKKSYIFRMILVALTIAAMTLLTYQFYAEKGVIYAQTMAFIMLGVTQWANAFNARSFTKSIFRAAKINKMLWLSLIITIILQIIIIFSPINHYLKLAQVGLADFMIVSLIGSAVVIAISEMHKLIGYIIYRHSC